MPDRRGKRYEVFVDRRDGDLESLTLTQLIDLAEAPPADIPREELTRLACRIYDSRRLRMRFFENNLFGEPVWDMLLALYCLPSRNFHPSVTGLCHVANVAATTGLRWCGVMEQKGLIDRAADPLDARRAHVVLSARGADLMGAYLSTIYHKFTSA